MFFLFIDRTMRIIQSHSVVFRLLSVSGGSVPVVIQVHVSHNRMERHLFYFRHLCLRIVLVSVHLCLLPAYVLMGKVGIISSAGTGVCLPCHTTDARILIFPGVVVDLTSTGAVPQSTGRGLVNVSSSATSWPCPSIRTLLHNYSNA